MASKAKLARPATAVEISAERVVAARASKERNAVEQYAARSLPAGAVVPSFQADNVADGTALRQALAAALESVGPRTRDVIAVLPDAAARLMLMDFDTFPERSSEALSLLRFRLKKLLPFDADRAAVSYQASRNGNVRVVLAVAAESVVQEYESALRDVGYNPGVVMPSIAAALGLVDSPEPTLVFKSDAGTTSVAIAEHGELRLVRTLEGTAPASPEQLAEEVYPLLVFFEDTFGARIARVLLAGSLQAENLRGALEQAGTSVQDLVATAFAGGMAGAAIPQGALAGVAGSLLEW